MKLIKTPCNYWELSRSDQTLLRFLPGQDGEVFTTDSPVSMQVEAFNPEHTVLRLGYNAADTPGAVQPICSAKVLATDVFRQGFGMEGPSGIKSLQKGESPTSIESYGIIALHFDKGWLVLFTGQHRRYITRFSIDISTAEGFCHRLSANICTEAIKPDKVLPDLHFLWCKELAEGLKSAARIIAAPVNPSLKPAAYNWCSWYYYYNNLNEQQLQDFLENTASLPNPPEIQTVQIDAGYFPSAGDWLSYSPLFPNGLKAAFETIKAHGKIPGIWIAPFMVANRSRLYTDNPGWVLHHKDGTPVIEWRMYNEPKVWGYQDEEYYVLDTSNPDAMAYILSVFKTLYDWGARFFKTDFMLWGIHDSRDVIRHTPGKTSIEYYCDLMEGIKKAIGESYWLGCIAPFAPSIGYVNGMRIAADVGAQWNDNAFGPNNLLQEVSADNYFNGVYWQNDPDAVMLRDFYIYLTENEIEGLALLQAISGGAVYTSDDFHRLPANRINLFRFIKPDKIHSAELPLLEKKDSILTFVQRDGSRRWLYFFNPTTEKSYVEAKIQTLTGDKELYMYRYHSNDFNTKMESEICTSIPAHSGMLFFGNITEPITTAPKSLWNW